ncbi:MAG: type II secretion system major pseudopilin GspG [Planctomycetes bacterium]|nr:type II secretion system major pseudopilin GspG [Planctomycetota bacterium]
MNQKKRTTPSRPAEAGFTLVEIMVVIVILGLLATMVARNVIGASDEARETKAKTDIRMIADAVGGFRAKTGKLPESLEALATKDEKGRSELNELPKDPWGNDYQLREGDTPRDFIVLSWGPDGSEGTEDDLTSKQQKDK